MLKLLETLLLGLDRYIDIESDINKGALFCCYHKDHHIRCGEAAFPFIFFGKTLRNDNLIDKGLKLADWLVKRQNNDGSWFETPGRWVGTTVFQLMDQYT